MEELVFYLNYKRILLQNPDPEMTLLTFLREEQSLKGTKCGCGEGGCGACTVLVTKFVGGQARHSTINSCLALLASMHGVAITTVEGVGGLRDGNVHPVQETLASSHGTQCGFCTPGFVMSMFGLVCNVASPQLHDIEDAFQGNLCRCTGYRPILQGYSSFCKEGGIKFDTIDLQKLQKLKEETEVYDKQELHFRSKRVTWHRPTTLNRLVQLKSQHPKAKLVVGNTEVGIENKFRKFRYPVLIGTSHIPEMTSCERVKEDLGTERKNRDEEEIGREKGMEDVGLSDGVEVRGGIKVGVSCTLSHIAEVLRKEVESGKAHQGRFFKAVLQMLGMFASNQIRNVASIGGNIMTASPISDLNPLLVCALCPLQVDSLNQGSRIMQMDGDFFTGYRRTRLDDDDVLVSITLPFSSRSQYFSCFKQSRRREDDITIVNAAMTVTLNRKKIDVVDDVRIVYGGMAATLLVARNTRDVLIGRRWDEEMLKDAMGSLKEELFIELGAPGGMEAYRSSLSLSFFFKFFLEVAVQLQQEYPPLYNNNYFHNSNNNTLHNININFLHNNISAIRSDFNNINNKLNQLCKSPFHDEGDDNDDRYNNNNENKNNNLTDQNIISTRKHRINKNITNHNNNKNKLKNTNNNNNKYSNNINKYNNSTRPTFVQIFEDPDGNDVIISNNTHVNDSLINNDDITNNKTTSSNNKNNTNTNNNISITTNNKITTSNNNVNNNHNNKHTNIHKLSALTSADNSPMTTTTATVKNPTSTATATTATATTATTTPAPTTKATTATATKVVGHPIQHLSALKHTTGEALYVDDMPRYKDELYLTLVQSTKSRARVLKVDFEEALKMEGVVGMVDFRDVTGVNEYAMEEFVFVEKEVTSQGQPIAGLLTLSKFQGQMALAAVKIEYEELKPIITIQEAIEASSFFPGRRSYQYGCPDEGMEVSEHKLEGEVSIGGQEHFYMETNACVVVPREDGGCFVISNSQNPPQMQESSALVLGVESNRVDTKIVRAGGGFGGKETRTAMIVVASVVASNKFNRPVRCVLERNEDMMMTGGRHPFYAKYKIGFSSTGQITSLILNLYSNCGFSPDLSPYVMERGMIRSNGSYNTPNIRINCFTCKTNLPSNTAFRGFGSPQGTFICEDYIQNIADFLDLPVHLIRERNMIKVGDTTLTNQRWTEANMQRCWSQVKRQVGYEGLLKEVEEFNSKNRWKKRGVCIMPSVFGLGYDAKSMMMGAALVNVFKDGSVVVYSGGVEMGQGLHTKLAQVAAEVLKIPLSRIRAGANDANVVPNTLPTSASLSSDLNGMAVLIACKKLMDRLEPIMTSAPDKDWNTWIKMAIMERVSLSAVGYYKVPDLNYDEEALKGEVFHYFTVGAGCSLVEIDCLTGDHWVLRADVVMDVGKSLNPAIDIGQIEGAFMQGYGLFTLEDLKYSPNGNLYTLGPGAYKIPCMDDTPRHFNVTILKGCSNEKAVYSSKGIGEPPLLLAISVFFAIKHAIQSARRDSKFKNRVFRLDAPATSERIRMACADEFTKMYDKKPSESYKPWFANV